MRPRTRKKALIVGSIGIAVVGAGVAWLIYWHKMESQREKAQAAAAQEFASFSAEDVEKMRVRPPSGSYIVRTSGSCSGKVIFTKRGPATIVSGSTTAAGELPAQILLAAGQSANVSGRWVDGTPFSAGVSPLTGGSVNVSAGTPNDAFSGRIPPQPLTYHRRDDGWQVARISGTFFWYDAASTRAPSNTLPEEIQAAAEDVEKQARLTYNLKKRIDLMPWNATNADKLRQRLLGDLKAELVRLHNLEVHMAWVSVRQGIPGYPSLVTKEADLAWQLGCPPTLQPPQPTEVSAKVELRPED